MFPAKKICPICHKSYKWNPDVGKLFCPHCLTKMGKTEPKLGAAYDGLLAFLKKMNS